MNTYRPPVSKLSVAHRSGATFPDAVTTLPKISTGANTSSAAESAFYPAHLVAASPIAKTIPRSRPINVHVIVRLL